MNQPFFRSYETGQREKAADVFHQLKTAYENAVQFVIENGFDLYGEVRRSELFHVVLNEALRRRNG
ncbi:MAG: hypothetical protein K6T39_01425 [Anoxybacillus ayderensis]|nr:hypothetical protein [Anoxybacillus ayderensis]